MKVDQLTTILASQPTTEDRIGQPHPYRSNEKYRDIASEWDIMDGHTDPDRTQYGEVGRIVADLTTYHYKDRKEFVSTLRVSIVGSGMRQTTMAFGTQGESVVISREPSGPRFSAKNMRQHHVEALAFVEAAPDRCAEGIIEGVRQYLPTPTVVDAAVRSGRM